MIKKVIESLENIAHTARASSDPMRTDEAIGKARAILQAAAGNSEKELGPLLGQLDKELETWQSKLQAIFSEPVGRQGIVKHTSYWVERLKKCKTH